MNKLIKALSVILVLTSSVYLPNANASSIFNAASIVKAASEDKKTTSTEMLITLAETNPVLIDRLNDIALNNIKLLNQLLKMAEADAKQLERLLDLAENDADMFSKLVNIYNAQTTLKVEDEQVSPYGQMSTFGIISDGDLMQ